MLFALFLELKCLLCETYTPSFYESFIYRVNSPFEKYYNYFVLIQSIIIVDVLIFVGHVKNFHIAYPGNRYCQVQRMFKT